MDASATPRACDDDDERQAIGAALASALPLPDRPPVRLHRAMREAVAGGKRQRSRLALAVGRALGLDVAQVMPLACALELVHAASLVHDDLPAFDDAPMRRGRPSCHAAHGEPAAILCGDALLAHAFVTIARGPRPAELVALLGEAVGSELGIIGGQAMELEASVDLRAYHAAKTAALYRLAAEGPACIAGVRRDGFRAFGETIGLFAQLADDLIDVSGDAAIAAREGKPVGRDLTLGRPNVALSLGLDGAQNEARLLAARVLAIADELGAPGRLLAAWFEAAIAR